MSFSRLFFVIGIVLLCGLFACAPLPAIQPTLEPVFDTQTPAATDTPTATIVWFPPTSTPATLSQLEASPTPEERPGTGEIIFKDDFSDASFWQTASSDQAGAIIDINRLTLVIRAPKTSIISLRNKPMLTNFYAEVTARTNLCSGNDDYGMLFRAASGADYYRFALSCDGTIRVDRIREGQSSPLQLATPSGDAPPGSPGETRIGVWVSGNEMRFFLNGRYQFSATDPLFGSGAIGFFARSGGDNAVSVSFSDLVVNNVVYVSPTPTVTPAPTLKPTRTPRWTPTP
jgi:hypothetical protein